MAVRAQTIAPWVGIATEAADAAGASAGAAAADRELTQTAKAEAEAAALAAAAAVDPGYLAATRAYYKSLEWPIEPALGAVAFPDLPLPSYAALARAGTAYAIGPTGLIRSTAANTARDAYHPTTGEYLGKRIQGRGAKNLWLQSRTLSTSPNTVSRATLLANQAIGPDGTNSAFFLKEDTTASNTHSLSQSFSFTAGKNYWLVAVAKAVTRGDHYLGLPASAFDIVNNNPKTAYFDLEGGTYKAGQGNPTRNMMAFREGWQVSWIAATATATATGNAGFRLATGIESNNDFYTGDGSSGLYLYSLALYESDAPLSSLPPEAIVTTSAAVTQPAEKLAFTGVSAALSQTSGAMVFRGRYDVLAGLAETLMSVDSGSGNGDAIRLAKGTDEVLIARVVVGGVTQATVTLDAVEAGRDFCVAAAWGGGELVASMNGAPPVTATIASLPTVSAVRLFQNADDSAGFDGYFQNAGLYGVRVDNAQLRNLSQLAAPDRSREQAILQKLAAPMILSKSRGAITATAVTYGLDLSAANKFADSVFLRDASGYGHVISPPITTTTLLDITTSGPNAQTAVLTNYGTTISSGAGSSGTSGGRWTGARRLSSTRAICAPARATKPLIIDRAAGTISMPDWQATYGVDLSDTGNPKYTKPVRGFDGKVYFGPSYSHNMLVWDEAAGTCVQTDFGLTALFSVDQPWGQGVLYPNGLIVYPPFLNSCWLIVDTNYSPARVYTTYFGAPPLLPPSTFGSTGSLSGGSIDWRGNIFVPAFDAEVCALVDMRLSKVQYGKFGAEIPLGKGQWAGSTPLPSGRILCSPLDSPLKSGGTIAEGAFLEWDPILRKAVRNWYGATPWVSGHQFNGAAIADDGYVYPSPYSAQYALRIGPFAPFDEDILTSQYV